MTTALPRSGSWWMSLARVVWIVIMLSVVLLSVMAIPKQYAAGLEICTTGVCALGQLTPADVSRLDEIGLSPNFVSAFAVGRQLTNTTFWIGVGFIIFLKRSDNYAALFGSLMLVTLGSGLLSSTFMFGDPSRLITWASRGAYVIGEISLVFAYVFPDGRFRLRWTRWGAVVWVAFWVFLFFFIQYEPFTYPYTMPFLIGMLLSMGIAQVLQYRQLDRAAQQQVKWVAFGLAAAFGGFAVMLSSGILIPYHRIAEQGLLYNFILFPIAQLFPLLIPISILFAILRYRLYDIDLIIRRTLVYGAVSALLAGFYFGGVALLQGLFSRLIDEQSSLAVAISTLGIAALFTPVRRRVQGFVDRRFYRQKYDAQRTLERFGETLRDEVDLDQIQDTILDVVRQTVQPDTATLWLAQPKK